MPPVTKEDQVFISLLVDEDIDSSILQATLIDIDVTTFKKDEELFKAINETIRERVIGRDKPLLGFQPIDFMISSVCYADNY